MPVVDLKNETFIYPNDYFKFIGENDPSVIMFRNLIEKNDIPTLKKQWPGLSNRFRKLEIIAGHRGRPLIMDYFLWYDLNLKILSERLREEDKKSQKN